MQSMKRQRGRHGGGHGGARGPFGKGGFGREDFGVFPGRGEGRGRGGRGGFGHGGGRRGKRFAGEELRLMVLALLEGEDRHGYQIIREFAERSGEAYSPSPGVLYPMLTLLADMELVEEVAAEAGNRRSFRLTGKGRAELDANREPAGALFARLGEMAETAARTDAGPVRRAMMNLRTAAKQRLSREDANEDLVFRAAAILDEAAQKIERLQTERP